MNIAEFTIKNKVLSVIVILLSIGAGWSAYENMARFEDPEFTIRDVPIITQYPGASPLEVAEEVTEPLERALQEMQEIEEIKSTSSNGLSDIKVEIKYSFSTTRADLQAVITKIRNKMKDAEADLPPGAKPPSVYDDFGDVYGLYYFITGEGYSATELKDYAKQLQSEILQVEDVGKVVIGGEQSEAIFVEISRENAATLGVSLSSVFSALEHQNSVVAAGNVKVGDQRLIIDPSGAVDSVESIKNLLVSTSTDGGLIYLRDIANVWRGYQTPPQKMYRYNGEPAIALGVAGVLGGNIVKIGNAIEERLRDSESRRPIGIELNDYYHQGKIVDASVKDFVNNVIAALVIVFFTLLIFMGLQSAVTIGVVLLLTISATLAVMYISGIPMHRISLGALIIALGMMVDNAIVVTEGILIGVQKGRAKLEIAKSIVSQTKWPLLGGTLVGIIAFAPIGFAPGSTAEFTGHLFWVILIALMLSWVFAISLTPLFCYWIFRTPKTVSDDSGDNKGKFLSMYTDMMGGLLRARFLVVMVVVGVFLLAAYGMGFVKSGFFPASTTPQIVVDYWLPEGTDIERTTADMIEAESYVRELEGVNAVQTLIGAGGLRFMLVYGAESTNSAYGQLLIRLDDYRQIDALMPVIQSEMDARFPNAQAKVWRFQLGPGGGSKIEAAFTGPDPVVLRKLADEAKAIMIADGGALSIKNDWRQPVSVIEPLYSESNGRRAGISREDLAKALQNNFTGSRVGVYREGDELIPIISRAPESERVGFDDIRDIQILSNSTGAVVPIRQVTEGFQTVWRDGILKRENRVWTIKAQSDPYPEELPSELLDRLRGKIEAIALPDGYQLRWDGEYGASKESNENLATTLPMGLLAMVLTVFILFGSVRQPVVIWLVVPLAIIGVVIGLLVMDLPMEFMAILGVLSLSGLLIKNAIVLVDQIDLEIDSGKPRYQALLDAAASRVRPVMMGSLTTVLGVIPLYFDAFFQSMSVVLIFGLTFATLLTLVVIPVLYAIFFRIRPSEI